MDNKRDDTLNSILITAIIIAFIVSLSFVIARYFQPQLDSLRSSFKSNKHRTLVEQFAEIPDPKKLPVSRKPSDTIDLGQIVSLRHLLESEKFNELNTELAAYQALFKKDPKDENKVFDAYIALAITDPRYEELIQKWIAAFPDNYQPYLAMGRYYYAKGWESRGEAWIKDTSEKQIEGMHQYFAKAQEYLKHALKINPDMLVAYSALIGIYSASGDDASENRVIAESISRFPYSFIIRRTASWAKEPRWGGSYGEMIDIAKGAEKYADVNPKLTSLYGFAYCDLANIAERNKKYLEARALLEQALRFGECGFFDHEMAWLYFYDLDDNDTALAYINRSIEFCPNDANNYLLQSKIHFQMRAYAVSLKSLSNAETVNPRNDDIRQWHKLASNSFLKLGNRLLDSAPTKAIAEFNLSLEYNHSNYESYYGEGVAYCRIGALDSALSEFKEAIDINPHQFASYRMIDFILTRKKQWDEIIGYWDRFLKLEPNNVNAYYERSVAYYHKGDIKYAMADLEKACKLGSEEACKTYRKELRQKKAFIQ